MQFSAYRVNLVSQRFQGRDSHNRWVIIIAKGHRDDTGNVAIGHGNATNRADHRAAKAAEPLLPDALNSQPVQQPGGKYADGCAGVHHNPNHLGRLRVKGFCQSHVDMYDSHGLTSGYFCQLTRLLRVPISLISISQRSLSFMFSVAPSVPIHSTSPGTSVRYLLISLM